MNRWQVVTFVSSVLFLAVISIFFGIYVGRSEMNRLASRAYTAGYMDAAQYALFGNNSKSGLARLRRDFPAILPTVRAFDAMTESAKSDTARAWNWGSVNP